MPLYSNIDGAAGLAAAVIGFIPAFGSVAITAGLVATIVASGRVNGTLRNRDSRLGLYSGRGLRHNILCGKAGKNGYVDRSNLHIIPAIKALFKGLLLPERSERSLKHLVADSSLEGMGRDNLSSESSFCGVVVL
jgi:hypothetical protein